MAFDALERAQQSIERAESYYDTAEEKDGNAFYRGRGDIAMANAAIFAAVAQAKQLKRIADALENLSGAYTTATFGVMPQDNPE